MNIGICGYGIVGQGLGRFLGRRSSIRLTIHDKFDRRFANPEGYACFSKCDFVFVAVPTPTSSDGMSCDLESVHEVVSHIDVPMCIKSTIPPGTTVALVNRYKKSIAFSPEYMGEGPRHPWPETDSCGFVIVGGSKEVCRLVSTTMSAINPNLSVRITDAISAEMCKYMENCFLATKVIFMNQFHELCSAADLDFETVRDLFLLDSRIGTSHTFVTDDRGFGGKCLPKDVRALIGWARPYGGAPLLERVIEFNERIREQRRSTTACAP
jgi:UDPglucose 6-dehydrogenase